MTRKLFTTLALLATAATGAHAADQNVDLSSLQAQFESVGPVLQGGDDKITFVGLAAGTYDFLLSVSTQNIAGLTATLNGQAATVNTFGKFSFGYLEATGSSPFTLVLTGTPAARALYTGELTVSAVPEPETYAMLLAGLAGMGFMARRRSR